MPFLHNPKSAKVGLLVAVRMEPLAESSDRRNRARSHGNSDQEPQAGIIGSGRTQNAAKCICYGEAY